MADELKIGGSVDPKLLTGLKEYQAAIRSIDLLYKQNKLSADEVKVAVKQLQDRVKESNIDWTKQVSLMTSLHHVNERAAVGFKSMSRTLKEMYAEERVQNRTLSEMKQTMQSLSSVIGGEAGRQAGTLFANFQGLEFAMQSSGLAAGRMGGAFSSLGSTLVSLATPLGIAGAAFLTLQGYMAALRDETQSYIDTINRIEGRLAEVAKRKLDRAKEEEGGFFARLLSGTPGLRGVGMGMLARDVTRTHAAQAEYDEAIKKQNEQAAKNTPPDWGRRITGAGGADPYGAMRSAFGVRGTSEIAPGAAFAGRVRAPNAPDTASGIKIAQEEFSAFQQSFGAGVAAMGNTLSMTVGGAFATVFGGAHTLLGSFASAFASTMADLASRWVFGKLLGAVFGAATGGPVGAVLGAGISPSGAGGGGAVAAKLDQVVNAVMGLELRVDNVGLYMGSERGRVQYATR